MSVLGYSEIMKEIYGITPKSLENEISSLLKSKPDKRKITILKSLAIKKRGTIGELMRLNKMNNTGGSFRSIEKFFTDLIKLEILKKEKIGRRTYFTFQEESNLLKWLQN